MVVKKTVKKISVPEKKVSPVIIETKKSHELNCGTPQNLISVLLIILLFLNLVVGSMNYFKPAVSGDAWEIETLKVGGEENLELVKKLYNMESYKQQQKGAIMQVLSSFALSNQGENNIEQLEENLPMELDPTEVE